MDWNSIIIALCGTISGGGIAYLLNYRNNRRIAKAQAQTSEWELYDKRIEELHETVELLNTNEKNLSGRIVELNGALDGKTAQIRKLTERLWQAERDLNVANERVTSLTGDNGNLRLEVERYKNWHCRKAECGDRLPPNPSLVGKTWNDGKIRQTINEKAEKA